MPRIATLTMNPAIDLAFEVDRVRPTHKLRTKCEQYDPGGGGINVARVFVRLGGEARCYYLSGGTAGALLDGLLDERRLDRHAIPIAGGTRISANVIELETGLEYRFVPPGPGVSPAECQAALTALAEADGAFLVASGSLPPGVPSDFYARVARLAAERGLPFALDTSGEPLRGALAAGGIYLVKPSVAELETLVGRKLAGRPEVEAAARALVDAGQAQLVAVTLGAEGGLLVSPGDSHFVAAPQVEAKSATGAGDSFMAAMLFRLASGDAPRAAFRYAIAAGAAAVLTPGTEMCRPEDIERLLARMDG